MSITKRLINLARAEIGAAVRKLGGTSSDLADHELEEELARHHRASKSTLDSELPADICRAYGNLELPIGASADEIRAAYRRLMRRYHPDKHHHDDDSRRVANELTQQLRAAHDKLLEHLEKS